MSIVVKCRCKRRILFPDSAAGLEGECPKCSSTFVVRRPLPWRWIVCGLLLLPLSGAMALPRLFRPDGSTDVKPIRTADDFANDFATSQALAVALDAKSLTTQAKLEAADDVDVFQVPCAGATSLTVTLRRPRSSKVAADLAVYDTQQKQLQSTEITGDLARSEIQIPLNGAETCFIKVSAADETTGAYELVVAASSDIGDTPDSALTLDIPRDGTASIDSRIDKAGDTDLFRIVAPMTGTLTVWQRATESGAGRLNSYLTAYDADMLYITFDDSSGLNDDAKLSFSVSEGLTYFIRAEGYESLYSEAVPTGAYSLTASCLPYSSDDAIGDTPETAQQLTFYDNSATYDSIIDQPGDRDLFRIDATESLSLRVDVSIPLYSSLQAQVTIYDSSMTQLAISDVSSSAAGARIMAEAGRTYYASVAYAESLYAYGVTTGDYSLIAAFEPPSVDSISDAFAEAQVLNVDVDGWAYFESRIDASFDEDMFRFTATFDGEIDVRMKSILSSGLDSLLIAYDAEFNEIARDDDGGEAEGDARLIFPIARDATYYLKAAGYESLAGIGSTGDYALSLYRAATSPTPAPSGLDDYSGTRDYAHTITVQPDAPFTIDGMVEHGYDLDYFRLVAPLTGTLTITVTPLGESNLDTELLIQNSLGDSLGTNDNVSATDSTSRLQLDVREGETYYVIAAASLVTTPDRTTGAYRVTILPPGASAPDDDDETAPDAPTSP